MSAPAVNDRSVGSELLVRHCLALESEAYRLPARDRLDAVLGNELARRLLSALTRVGRNR